MTEEIENIDETVKNTTKTVKNSTETVKNTTIKEFDTFNYKWDDLKVPNEILSDVYIILNASNIYIANI